MENGQENVITLTINQCQISHYYILGFTHELFFVCLFSFFLFVFVVLDLHLEVVRIHVQSLGVQFAQLGENALDVVQVIYSLIQTFHHCLPVVLHTSILPDGFGVA